MYTIAKIGLKILHATKIFRSLLRRSQCINFNWFICPVLVSISVLWPGQLKFSMPKLPPNLLVPSAPAGSIRPWRWTYYTCNSDLQIWCTQKEQWPYIADGHARVSSRATATQLQTGFNHVQKRSKAAYKTVLVYSRACVMFSLSSISSSAVGGSENSAGRAVRRDTSSGWHMCNAHYSSTNAATYAKNWQA